MGADVEGIKNANDTGFMLLAKLQGARLDLLDEERARSTILADAKVRYDEDLRVLRQKFSDDQARLLRTHDDAVNAAQVKVNEKLAARDKSDKELADHQEATRLKYGASMDFKALVDLITQDGWKDFQNPTRVRL